MLLFCSFSFRSSLSYSAYIIIAFAITNQFHSRLSFDRPDHNARGKIFLDERVNNQDRYGGNDDYR